MLSKCGSQLKHVEREIATHLVAFAKHLPAHGDLEAL